MSNSDTYTHVFILSLVDIDATLPYEIIPGHIFKKPDPDQIEFFKKWYNTLRPFPKTDYFLYERSQVEVIPGEQQGHLIYQTEELPKEKWKYWVISHNGYNHEIEYLQQASLLIKNEIELGLQMFTQGGNPGYSLGGPAIINYLLETQEAFGSRHTITITLQDLKNITEYYSLIKNIDPSFDTIRSAVKLFDELRALPRESDFVVIGLFSIIESLISHSPRLEFFHDSIKHQFRTKIPLLRKRFPRDLKYADFFDPNAKEETILSKLYDYRSSIVHTGNSKLPRELENILKGKKEVKAFLKELTKLLLIIAIEEPELVIDLKAC